MKTATRQRAYLREATIALAIARLAVRFVSPARIFAWANRPPRRLRRFANDEADWISWAVDSISARSNVIDFARALAAHAMLRRHGIASRLCLGVSREGGDLATHAWVEIGRDKIIAGKKADGYVSLAGFGGTC